MDKYEHDLPAEYRDAFAKDGQDSLHALKQYLPLCLALRDLDRPLRVYLRRLESLLNGKFPISAADREFLAKVLSEILVVDGLSMPMVELCAQVLHPLLKHHRPADLPSLQIPWRPLFNLYASVHDSLSSGDWGLARVLKSLRAYVDKARRFFPAGSTAQIWALLRPLFNMQYTQGRRSQVDMCWGSIMIPFGPHSDTCDLVQDFACLFLPDTEPAAISLWSADVMQTMLVTENQRALLGLVARCAKHSLGVVDWTEHVPAFYTVFLKVRYTAQRVAGAYECDEHHPDTSLCVHTSLPSF